MSSNPVQHQHTKHIEIDIHFVRDKVAIGHVRVLHVLSSSQYADIFMKGLSHSLFSDFKSSLNVCNSDVPTAGDVSRSHCPMQFLYGNYSDNVPALRLDPNSWTKVANVIYLDAPTLTGYSYTKTSEAIRSSDMLSASQTVEFIRKFVRNHPKFLNNPMYVTGISYSGIVIPIITEKLYKGNDEGLEPMVNVKGYMAGNPLTDKTGDIDSRLEYAYRMALISKELFESTRNACNGEYAEADSNNLLCMSNIHEVNKRVKQINIQQILDPDCKPTETNLFRTVSTRRNGYRRSLLTNQIKMIPVQSSVNYTFCRFRWCLEWMPYVAVLFRVKYMDTDEIEWITIYMET
ncbi:serine carboxypeptidase-like 19 [Cynara cardunculus var. scolymus]|uniref:serine carboxypeptidase-like 19 n=1 Tax=Cynara cardunculus var. scolymus TaxID=59895 RepID=UPI000D62A465|nr:serine carboxypeptidase-like 19 [Cynara cardunculus var. scolymus]